VVPWATHSGLCGLLSIRLKPSVATLACFDDGALLLVMGVFTPFMPEASDEASPPENKVDFHSVDYSGWFSTAIPADECSYSMLGPVSA